MHTKHHQLLHRIAIAVAVAAVLGGAALIAWQFIPVFVYSVFLYYSVRPVHRVLSRFNLRAEIRAIMSIAVFGGPFVFVIGYTGLVIIGEAQTFFNTFESQQAIIDALISNNGLELTESEFRNILNDVQANIDLENGIVTVTEILSQVISGFISLVVILVLTYTMLVDGPRLKSWVVDVVDMNGVAEEYASHVDKELSAALFGNIVNVFATAAIAVLIFTAYNIVAIPALKIPVPGLLGALAGIGSLIPLIGIKLVYVPLTAWLVANSIGMHDGQGFTTIVVLFVLSVVVIDFIPDTFIRAIVSGNETHTPGLIIAYIVGASALGFYGLFLAPILFVVLVCAGNILVPYVVSGELPDYEQQTLDSYGDGSGEGKEPRSDVVRPQQFTAESVTSVLQKFR